MRVFDQKTGNIVASSTASNSFPTTLTSVGSIERFATKIHFEGMTNKEQGHGRALAKFSATDPILTDPEFMKQSTFTYATVLTRVTTAELWTRFNYC
jgi:hypothetical protein